MKRRTEQEMIDIGRQLYTHEISRKDAMEKYGVRHAALDKYLTLYKKANGIPFTHRSTKSTSIKSPNIPLDIEAYQAMTKEELINELILAKINEARAKKGYEVKGVGSSKEYISLNSKNSKS